jgi:hypothetical protein
MPLAAQLPRQWRARTLDVFLQTTKCQRAYVVNVPSALGVLAVFIPPYVKAVAIDLCVWVIGRRGILPSG